MAKLKQYQMYVDGQWVDAEGGKTFESVNPATGEMWAEIPAASEADVDRAVAIARNGQGPTMAVFKISADVPPQIVPPRDGAHLVARFRAALAAAGTA